MVFVDIDFPELIKKKTSMIKKTKDILNIIGEPMSLPKLQLKQSKNNEGVLLATPHYLAIGCDLTLLEELKELLSTLFEEKDTLFAFTAEVSVTYMPNLAADNLIAWASQFTESRFVLLEQIVPSGPDHPFAKTMLKHFNKLNTPLNSVLTYQKVTDQKERFHSRGWTHVQASDLYQFWEKSITNKEKEFLDSVEGFDEWEEFILFCQHYVILYASTSKTPSTLLNVEIVQFPGLQKTTEKASFCTTASTALNKKFAAGHLYDSNAFIQNGGLTTQRTNNSVLVSRDESLEFKVAKEPFKDRMCHSLCNVNGTLILTGGRLAPSSFLSDCWKLENNEWKQIQDLPEPRYRHVSFATNGELYVFGGSLKTKSTWIKFTTENGWTQVKQTGSPVPNLMSPAVAFNETSGKGYIFGGMTKEYKINFEVYQFEVVEGAVNCELVQVTKNELQSLSRYGGQALYLDDSSILLAGGVSQISLIPIDETFVIFDTKLRSSRSIQVSDQISTNLNLPLLSGFNMGCIGNDVIMYGGGAICFSFGSYWNDITVLSLDKEATPFHAITKAPVVVEKPKLVQPAKTFKPTQKKIKIKKVTRIQASALNSHDDFIKEVYSKNQPVVLEKNDLGSCTSKWNNARYLIESVGESRKIVAHVSDNQNLNFLAKNFKYETMEFGTFINEVYSDKPSKSLYLRSLSSDKPLGKPAFFRSDFESLSADFTLPEALAKIEETHFSSPFRVSSPNTAIWLHYDVTANILCQAVGRKKVRLYPPSDVPHLSFPAGASTSLIENIFDFPQGSLPGRVHPFEAILEPGDILFIPATWLHATLPLETSISVNFFWKDLAPAVYGHGKDIYGNKDIEAYENGRKAVQKIEEAFKEVPEEVKRFYLLRLADELKESAKEGKA